MELISVVVPVYNVEKYLERCVVSIVKQTYTNLEIVLVDDGSTDQSGFICDEIKNQDDRIKVVHKLNEGLGLTRNRGVREARGDYICFIDSDDYIDKQYIETIYFDLKKHAADVCYCGHTKNIDGKYEIRKNPLAGEVFLGQEINDKIIPRMCGCRIGNDNIEMSSCMAIYSTKIIKKYSLEFPSERQYISEDLIFNINCLAKCNKICMSDCVGYFYVTVSSSLTRKYNPDRLHQQIIMTKKVIELTQEIGVFTLSEDRIYNNFMTWVRAIIKAEQNRYSEIGLIESINRIAEICDDNYVKKISNKFDNVGVKKTSKMINILIKQRAIVLLWIIMFIKNKWGV